MRALVVYESMFGNTRAIAEAVAAGLEAHLPVLVREVSGAPIVLDEDVRLLVAGGPTHAFGMSRARTREQGSQRGGPGTSATGLGIREWLGQVRRPGDVAAATFDTRANRPRLPGSAARARAHEGG